MPFRKMRRRSSSFASSWSGPSPDFECCAPLFFAAAIRLTRPPLNLETDEILGGVVASLLTANADGPLANRAPILRARSATHALAAQSLADVIERESRGNWYFDLAGIVVA